MSSIAAAERVEVFDVTAAAGTAQATPTETAITFAPGQVVGLEIIIPDGHMGLTGIQLAQAHRQTIPRTAGAFIVGNNEVIRWPLDGYLNTGSWSAFVYNLDAIEHHFQLRFLLVELARSTAPPTILPPIDPALIELPAIADTDQGES